MNAEQLTRMGKTLVRRCGTRDPFAIAEDIGADVRFCENFGPLKGMYRVIKRNRFIFINEELSEPMQRIVCAHELGHDQAHRRLANGKPLWEFTLYDAKSKAEYEANVIAAEILLDTDELLEYVFQYRYSAEQIAQAMETDVNLVALKIASLNAMGYKIRLTDYQSDFLK